MGQKYGEKWVAAVYLQPTIPKSDRLLGTVVVTDNVGEFKCVPGLVVENWLG